MTLYGIEITFGLNEFSDKQICTRKKLYKSQAECVGDAVNQINAFKEGFKKYDGFASLDEKSIRWKIVDFELE